MLQQFAMCRTPAFVLSRDTQTADTLAEDESAERKGRVFCTGGFDVSDCRVFILFGLAMLARRARELRGCKTSPLFLTWAAPAPQSSCQALHPFQKLGASS